MASFKYLFGDDNGVCGVEMTGLRNWRQQQRRRQRKMGLRTQHWKQMRRWRKQKRRRAQVNVSNGGGDGVFTGQGIDNYNGGLDQGLSNNDVHVGGEQGIDDASKRS